VGAVGVAGGAGRLGGCEGRGAAFPVEGDGDGRGGGVDRHLDADLLVCEGGFSWWMEWDGLLGEQHAASEAVHADVGRRACLRGECACTVCASAAADPSFKRVLTIAVTSAAKQASCCRANAAKRTRGNSARCCSGTAP